MKIREDKTYLISPSQSHLTRYLCGHGLFLLLLIFNNVAIADAGRLTATETAVKAAYIYNILRFVSWDDSSALAHTESLNVCLYNSHSFKPNLEPMTKKVIDGKKIRISTITSIEQPSCHLIFIDNSDRISAGMIAEQSKNNDAILLGNDEAFIKNGGLFGFYIEDNKVRLSANRNTLAKTRLNISSLLIEVCRLYGGE